METADIFTIVYGSAYLIIVLYLSIYCWLKLEDELIFIIQKITVEYKKIASAVNVTDNDKKSKQQNSMEYNPTTPATPSYQFSFQSVSASPIISQRIAKHLNASSYNSSIGSFNGSMMSWNPNSFLRPIPDMYYEKFIKPFDVYITDIDQEEKDQTSFPNIQDEHKQSETV